MGLINFVPEVWSAYLLSERVEEAVFAKLCNTDYDGEILDMGDRVHFTGIARPTVRAYTQEQTLTAEYMTDNTVEMVIDKAYYFDVLLDDVNKKQLMRDPMPEFMKGARAELVDTMEANIAALYAQAGTSVSETQVSSANIISTISSAYTKLRENKVPTNEEVVCVVSPAVAEKIMMADIVFNTDNSGTLSGGWVGKMKRFLNISVYSSNNVYSPSTVDYCMMFTKKAIALAEQVPAGKIEQFRPSAHMANGVKGLHVYGTKVIKPKELVTLNLTTVVETTI